jgi:putative endonuclease
MGLARSRGEAGEALAAAYLELVGLEVVQRNVRLAGVEVDLMAVDGAARVVVEVKMRGRTDYGGAAGAIDGAKRARLIRAARSLEQPGGPAVRIDVIAIEVSPEGAALRHYRNAVTD